MKTSRTDAPRQGRLPPRSHRKAGRQPKVVFCSAPATRNPSRDIQARERPDLASVRCLYYAGCGDLSQWPCLQQSRRSIDVVLASSANRKRRSARLLSISPGPDQPDRLVTSEEIEQAAQRLATRRGERRIVRQHELG